MAEVVIEIDTSNFKGGGTGNNTGGNTGSRNQSSNSYQSGNSYQGGGTGNRGGKSGTLKQKNTGKKSATKTQKPKQRAAIFQRTTGAAFFPNMGRKKEKKINWLSFTAGAGAAALIFMLFKDNKKK